MAWFCDQIEGQLGAPLSEQERFKVSMLEKAWFAARAEEE